MNHLPVFCCWRNSVRELRRQLQSSVLSSSLLTRVKTVRNLRLRVNYHINTKREFIWYLVRKSADVKHGICLNKMRGGASIFNDLETVVKRHKSVWRGFNRVPVGHVGSPQQICLLPDLTVTQCVQLGPSLRHVLQKLGNFSSVGRAISLMMAACYGRRMEMKRICSVYSRWARGWRCDDVRLSAYCW